MTFDLSWVRGHVESWDGRFSEVVDLQGKVGNQLFQIVVLPSWFFRRGSSVVVLPSWFFRRGSSVVVLPLEVFDLLTGGVSHRVPGEPLFPRFHEASPELAEGSLVQA